MSKRKKPVRVAVFVEGMGYTDRAQNESYNYYPELYSKNPRVAPFDFDWAGGNRYYLTRDSFFPDEGDLVILECTDEKPNTRWASDARNYYLWRVVENDD